MKKSCLILLVYLIGKSIFAQSCLPTGITFSSQSQIDSFQSDYPGCIEIDGDVVIEEDLDGNITSLNGLSVVNNIEGGLTIVNNSALINLSGLENLITIKAALFIGDNNSLTNLDGLSSLTSLGQPLTIARNSSLTNVNGLSNLDSILLSLVVIDNPVLTSLSGLDNIDYATFYSLTITNNNNLSICHVQSVCDFLEFDGFADISGNASGCISDSEVKALCLTSIDELLSSSEITIQVFPNPTKGIIQIKDVNLENWEFSLWSSTGILIKNQFVIDNNQIDLSPLPSGIYFLKMKNNDQFVIEKIIKE